jgi:hypothetical protein
MRKVVVAGVILSFLVLFIFMLGDPKFEGGVAQKDNLNKPEKVKEVSVIFDENFEKYNYDYVDEKVKEILTSMILPDGKTAFYLPPTDYINVSSGSKFGVAYALNNANPAGDDDFVLNWSAGSEDCGVGLEVVDSWIERGWYTWGKIPKGWVDHLTVYFAFPEGVSGCSVSYDFLITRNGKFYDSENVLFNIK